MDSIWPWLAIAGAGALHGLNPVNGWMFAAACGLRSGDRRHAGRALMAIAAGHAASVVWVAAAAALGWSMDRGWLQAAALGLLAVALAARCPGRIFKPAWVPAAGQAGLAAWSFMMSVAHGAGWLLLPALASLCTGQAAAAADIRTDPLLLTVMAAGIHTAVMLGVAGILTWVACRSANAGVACLRALRRQPAP
ncbi:hypothetical protein [Eleftheria terrae]|uniref:hypothetical protein n=1 Tax=Eleftheria terrae TaxID=1597781 RepID=UPI00263B702A|nr:hypothetical protein [Eleftheria terrae]WKB50620.1 hypothetical protein N7L95_12270 [Eleftheria terrae]